ncbi:hypothetical protein BDZ90DRAFT_241074, partial [Jaminaea rosea]
MYHGYQYSGPPPHNGAPPPTAAWNGGYQQQQQHSPAPPAQAPPYGSDPNAFAAMYKSHLASLTFNSKPIITNLTVMAHENVQSMANVVARCIDEHITQSPPPFRLPSLYLLDSISKNIGAPYTTLWSQRISHLFLDSYRLVDQPTKVRMEELLNTWRAGASDGSPLFGGDAQWDIERNLYGSQGPPPSRPSGSRSPMPHGGSATHNSAQGEQQKAVEKIDSLLAFASQDPSAFNPTRVAALKQLKTVVQTATLSPQEMEQIHAQLASLSKEMRARSSTPTLAPPPPPQPPQLPPGLSDALASLTKGGGLSSLLGANGSNGASSASSQTLAVPHPGQPPAAPGAAAGSNDLIKSLMAAGLIPTTGLPAPQPAAGPSKPAVFEQDASYTSSILSLEIQLTSLDLHKELPDSALPLVLPEASHLPLQCRQCANRYPPAAVGGQKSLDTHLDWHFRQGRRAKDSAARGMTRVWLDKENDWVRGGYDDPASTGGEGGSGTAGQGGAGASGKALSAQQEAELAAAAHAWVVAPTAPALANAPCPICKEKFTSEWNEDEEEWVWKNAIKKSSTEGGGGEKIYHGTCYHSAKFLSANVAGKFSTPPLGMRRSTTAAPGEGRERTATPSAEALLGGRKRKQGEGDEADWDE